MRRNIYLQSGHVVVIGGIPVTNFAEGDFIQIQTEGGSASRIKGGDGPAMSLSVKQGGKITVSILPTSPALGLLLSLRERMISNGTLFSIVIMSGVEEIITAGGCGFGELPQFATGGDKMTARNFDIECLNINLDTSGVEAVTGGLL